MMDVEQEGSSSKSQEAPVKGGLDATGDERDRSSEMTTTAQDNTNTAQSLADTQRYPQHETDQPASTEAGSLRPSSAAYLLLIPIKRQGALSLATEMSDRG